jgi:hypothetical protein
MLRRSLFLGIMVMLGAVLVYLVWKGRKEETRAVAARPKEVIRETKPTALRAISPPELSVLNCRLRLETESGVGRPPGSKSGGTQDVEIRNAGESEYQSVMLKISYLGRGNRILESRKQLVSQPLPPGADITVQAIRIESVPAGTTGCLARVLYADVATSK